MPLRSVARMTVSPLCACTGTPSTTILTRSSAMSVSVGARSGGLRPWGLGHEAASAVVDHVLELVTVMLEEALHRPGGGIAERADGVSLDVVRHIEQEPQLLAPRLPGEHAPEHAVHPAGALAARRALPARLRHVEARDALEHPHHAGGLVHDDGGAGAERGARGLHRVVVHVGLQHDLARHDRHRDAAGDYRL